MERLLLTACHHTRRQETLPTWTNSFPAATAPDTWNGPSLSGPLSHYFFVSASISFSDMAAAFLKARSFPLTASVRRDATLALVTSGWLLFAPAIPISRKELIA